LLFQCYEKFNKPVDRTQDYPLCAAQLKDRMDGAKDSETCIRRNNHQANLNPNKYCDPLADNNVYATVKLPQAADVKRENKSIIVAATRVSQWF